MLYCKRFRRFQRWCPLCATFILLLMAPITLWVAGGVFMPLTIVMGDACSSAENVAWRVRPAGSPSLVTFVWPAPYCSCWCSLQYFQGTADYACESLIGGTWKGDGNCEIAVGSLSEQPIQVNLWHAVQSIMESCSVHGAQRPLLHRLKQCR